jgi:hypothetical protein
MIFAAGRRRRRRRAADAAFRCPLYFRCATPDAAASFRCRQATFADFGRQPGSPPRALTVARLRAVIDYFPSPFRR